MRILQVSVGLGTGGAERVVLHLSTFLKRKGHYVEVANFLPSESDLTDIFASINVPVRGVRLSSLLSRWYPAALVECIRQLKPDVVHCHDSAWRKTAQACRIARVPCVWTMHLYMDEWIRSQVGWMRKATQHTQRLVGVEPGVVHLIQQHLPVTQGQVQYVPNGVPDIYCADGMPIDWGVPIPAGSAVIGMLARLEGNKDPLTLIRAAVLARKQCPNVHVVFAGRGSLEGEVHREIEAIGAGVYVHLLGLRRDVPAILHNLDIFVLSSYMEGQPLAILEAMSAQRPIVATDVGGNSILLDGGRCGILVPPRDPHALAEAILELLTNREKAQQLARNARQRFLEHFTIDAMGKRYLEVYQQAIEEFRRR